MVIRSRTLVPATAPPVEDGAVWISGGRIRTAGRWADIKDEVSGPVVDLGDAILFPGLVNAHCHLDYTNMAGRLAPPRAFPDWIKGILAAKGDWGFADFAASWMKGARQLLETGTTSVANIETIPEMLAEVRHSTPLRVFSYLEMTGVRSRLPGQKILDDAIARLQGLPRERGGVGLSPHAPYSTQPDLLAACAKASKADGWRVTTHVAESHAEFDMFMFRRGPMFDWLNGQRNMSDCGMGSPIQHLAAHGLLSANLLAVHVNYLWNNDLHLLASRDVSVAHCPRSHTFFRHQRFPLGELTELGVNVCVGTDSLASVLVGREGPPVLSMQTELREMLKKDPGLPPRELLRYATQNPARALGLKGVIGELWTGAVADLAVIPGIVRPAEAEAAVIQHRGPVAATMIGGKWEWMSPDWSDRIPSHE